jgi:hypothetical protein
VRSRSTCSCGRIHRKSRSILCNKPVTKHPPLPTNLPRPREAGRNAFCACAGRGKAGLPGRDQGLKGGACGRTAAPPSAHALCRLGGPAGHCACASVKFFHKLAIERVGWRWWIVRVGKVILPFSGSVTSREMSRSLKPSSSHVKPQELEIHV